MISKIYIPSAIETSFLYTANWINNNLLEPIFKSTKSILYKNQSIILIDLYISYSKKSLITPTENFVEPT